MRQFFFEHFLLDRSHTHIMENTYKNIRNMYLAKKNISPVSYAYSVHRRRVVNGIYNGKNQVYGVMCGKCGKAVMQKIKT